MGKNKNGMAVSVGGSPDIKRVTFVSGSGTYRAPRGGVAPVSTHNLGNTCWFSVAMTMLSSVASPHDAIREQDSDWLGGILEIISGLRGGVRTRLDKPKWEPLIRRASTQLFGHEGRRQCDAAEGYIKIVQEILANTNLSHLVSHSQVTTRAKAHCDTCKSSYFLEEKNDKRNHLNTNVGSGCNHTAHRAIESAEQ